MVGVLVLLMVSCESKTGSSLTSEIVEKVTSHPLYLKLTSDNEYGIRKEDLDAIINSSYSEKTKKLLISVAQDVEQITKKYSDEAWINKNANKVSLNLACGVLAEMAENNKVVEVFKVFVNNDSRMTANQLFWINYDKNHGAKPYPTKEDCDKL